MAIEAASSAPEALTAAATGASLTATSAMLVPPATPTRLSLTLYAKLPTAETPS